MGGFAWNGTYWVSPVIVPFKVTLMVAIGTIRCRLDAHDDDDDNAYLSLPYTSYTDPIEQRAIYESKPIDLR